MIKTTALPAFSTLPATLSLTLVKFTFSTDKLQIGLISAGPKGWELEPLLSD